MSSNFSVKNRVKFELEELKKYLGNGSLVNLDHMRSEINRIADVIEKIDAEAGGAKPKSKSTVQNGKDLEMEYESTINFWRGFHEQLPKCEFGLLERPFVRDVQIICRNGFIKVHRIVLIAASDLLRTIFKQSEEENPVVHLLDWSLNEVKLVIDLLYRGQTIIPSSSIEPVYEILECLKILNPQTNLDLNLSPATAKDLIQVHKSLPNFKEKKWLQNSIKLSAPRTLHNFTPTSVLHEFCPKMEFLYENQGAGFVVTAFFQPTNKTYIVTDSCKIGAKNKCAAQILDDLGIQVKYQSPPPDLNGTQNQQVVKEEVENLNSNGIRLPKLEVEAEVKKPDPTPPFPIPTSSIVLNSSKEISIIDERILKRIGNIPNLEENAFSAINNLNNPNPTQFEFLQEECPPNSTHFTCRLLSRNSWFYGTGMSKKDAKSSAAFKALAFILNPKQLEALCRKSKLVPAPLKNLPLQSKPIENQKSLKPSSSPSSLSSLQFSLSVADIEKRIMNIPNLEENARTALYNLNGCNSTYFEFPGEECPPNSSTFTCRVQFKNHWFSGTGVSKKEAKAAAAFQALSEILGSEKLQVLCKRSKTLKVPVSNECKNSVPLSAPSSEQCDLKLEDLDLDLDQETFDRIKGIENLDNNIYPAIVQLNTSLTPPEYEFEPQDNLNPDSGGLFNYLCTLKLMDQEFIAQGESKKKARENVGRKALMSILGPKTYQILADRSKTRPKSENPQRAEPQLLTLTQTPSEFFQPTWTATTETEIFSDFVHKLISEKCREMLKEDPDHSRGKVMAGVVMTTGIPLIKTAQIIAVDTGSKFIQGKSLSPSGEAIHDCHAEILVTRGLRDFLFNEIVSLIQGKINDSIFTRQPQLQIQSQSNGNTKNTGWKLKDGVEFHLYISTAPCGDARLFSDPSSESVVDSDPERGNRGLLRAKIEAGEGTHPVPATRNPWTDCVRQSLEELVGGERLKTMSCSDKICRWNILGVQGALLSHLILPIYYSSIVLGSHHHSEHFQRAVVGRIAELEKITGFFNKFKVNKPDLVTVSCQNGDKTVEKKVKGPNYAVLWVSYWNSYEVLNTRTGKIESESIALALSSRVSKRVAFTRFINILKLMKEVSPAFSKCSYEEAKLAAKEYQEMKAKFFELMQETNLGSWIRKPREVDMFKIDGST